MPTIIKLKLDSESRDKISKYLENNSRSIHCPKDSFHSTIWYTWENPFFQRRKIEKSIEDKLPLTIKPPYLFEVLGKNELTLKYKNDELLKLKKDLQKSFFMQLISGFDDLTKGEWDTLRKYLKKPQVEIVYPLGLRISSEKTGIVSYAESPTHITFAKKFYGNLKTLENFNDELRFGKFEWRV